MKSCAKCERPVRCRGLCKNHYERSRRLLSFNTCMVDATEAREHLELLLDSGMGTRYIAELSGVGRNSIREILIGRRHRPPSRRITRQNAEAILAVRPQLPAGARISALGSTRRLRALVAIGHTQTDLSERIDMSLTNTTRLFNGRQEYITVKKAAMIAELYDLLSMHPGTSERARREARRRGWAPPLAWDDIDDPNERPDKGERRAARWDEKFYELRQLGYSDIEIARRMNIHPDSVLRQMARYGITPSPQLVRLAWEVKHPMVSA